MMRKKNILFSTTRQSNPGDEFILLGCINLLKEVVGDFNPIIYNRSPEVRQSNYNFFRTKFFSNLKFRYKDQFESFFRLGFYDNSFKDDTDASCIDYAVFAGSPEWSGSRMRKMYDAIQKHNLSTVYLGIGGAVPIDYDTIKKPFRDVLKSALFIAVRDEGLYNGLRKIGANYLPCPALLSVEEKNEKQIDEVNKIALIFGTSNATRFNNVSESTYQYLMDLYTNIIKVYGDKYEIEMVCHYIDELPEVHKLFPGMKVHYSYDSKDYIDIFGQFDLVIGHRVHGIGISASQGIPGILISHDMRGSTGKGFLAEIVSVNEPLQQVVQLVDKCIHSIDERNKTLLRHKSETKAKYLGHLKSVLHTLGHEH